MRTIIYILPLLLALASCTEEFQLDTNNEKQLVIVDALITDGKPPYSIRLTTSSNLSNSSLPILGASIIITDNYGNKDSLISEYTERYLYYYDGPSKKDSTYYIDTQRGDEGYYRTQTLVGKPGVTYKINIKWQGEEYTSECYMPYCPKIDSVTYKLKKGAVGKSDVYIPHIWFKDNPETKDYYLFKTYGGGGAWSRSILSDELLSSDAQGLNVFQGESADWWRDSYPMPSSYYRIEMYSITEEVYNYYESLITQFRTDGGSYTPAPASPPTNIKGKTHEAQGVFITAGMQIIENIKLE